MLGRAVCVLFFCLSSFVYAEGEVFSFIDSYSYSEPTSIHSFIHDFEGKFEGGEYAFTESRAELGARYGAFSISYLLRYDHFYEFDNDTARGYYEVENKLPQAAGDRYNIDLDVNHIRANGIKAAFDFSPLDKLSVNVALSYLKANRILDGHAKGYLNVVDEDSYEGNVDLTLVGDEDKLLDFPTKSSEGKGVAVDIELAYPLSAEWLLALKVTDAFSKIKWDDSLYSQMHLTSAVREFDADGKLVTGPFLSGMQKLQGHTQKLPVKYRAQVTYMLSDHQSIHFKSYLTQYFAHNTLVYDFQLTDNQSVGISYTLETKAVGVSYRAKYFDFKLAADSFDYTKAHALHLSLGFKVPF